MALSLLSSESLRADAFSETNSVSATTPAFPDTTVLIICYLNQVNSHGGPIGGFGGAQIFITEYVQKGKKISGSWQFLNLDNISSVTFTLTVYNATVQAVGLVFAT
jgi:hypothetical protein